MSRYRHEVFEFGPGWRGTYQKGRVPVLRAEGWLTGPLHRSVRDDGVVETSYPFDPDDTEIVIESAGLEERVPWRSVSEIRPD